MKNKLFVLILLLLPRLIYAQWQQTNGPVPGCQVRSYAFSGDTIFAGTSTPPDFTYLTNIPLVYRSTNNGELWEAVSEGLPKVTHASVRGLAVNGENVFAGIEGYGVYLSTDGGSYWTAVNNGITDMSISALGVKDNMIFALYNFGVYRSEDNGASWQTVNNGIPSLDEHFTSIAINGTTIFISGEQTFKSNDDGNSWTLCYGGFSSIVCCGSTIVGCNTFEGIWRSSDDGTTWTFVDLGYYDSPSILAWDGTYLYGGTTYNLWGIYRSSDYGDTWMPVNNGIPPGMYYSLASNGNQLWAGYYCGIFRSVNNGEKWIPMNNGLPSDRVSALGTRWTNIYAGTNGGGIFRSTDIGTNWAIENTGLTSLNIRSFDFDGAEIFAASDSGIMISNTNGVNWTLYKNGLTCLDVRTVMLSGNNCFAGTEGGGVFLSTDNGTTWTARNSGLSNLKVRTMVTDGSSIFCGTKDGGIFRSTDDGNTWTSVSNGLTDMNVNVLIMNGSSIFVGTENGVFFSTDNGTTWTAVNDGLANTSINAFALSEQMLFAGTDKGLYLYSPGELKWYMANDGMPDTIVTSLAVSKTDLFAGLVGKGVWTRPLSEFSVMTIYPENLVIDMQANSHGSLYITSNTDWVLEGILPDWLSVNKWTGTGNDSLTFQSLKENTSGQQQSAAFTLVSSLGSATSFTIIQNARVSGIDDGTSASLVIYPNPTVGVIAIETESDFEKATLFNSMGQQVFECKLNRPKTLIDLHSLANGVYTIRISGKNNTLVRQVIVL